MYRYAAWICVFLWVCGWQKKREKTEREREREREREMSWSRIITSCILISLAGLMDTSTPPLLLLHCVVSTVSKLRAFPTLFPYHKKELQPLCNVTCNWPRRSSRHIQSPPRGLKGDEPPIQCQFWEGVLRSRFTRLHSESGILSLHLFTNWVLPQIFCLKMIKDKLVLLNESPL